MNSNLKPGQSYRDMKKARVDEGKSPEQKKQARAQRETDMHFRDGQSLQNTMYAADKGVHLPGTSDPKAPKQDQGKSHMGNMVRRNNEQFPNQPDRHEIARDLSSIQHAEQTEMAKPNLPGDKPKQTVRHPLSSMTANQVRAYTHGGSTLMQSELGSGQSFNDIFKCEILERDHFNLYCPEDFSEEINGSLDGEIQKGLGGLEKSDKGQPKMRRGNVVKMPIPHKSRGYKLLSDESNNLKTAKNASRGSYLSAILHLAPADLAGRGNMCPGSSEGCRHACLNTSGRGGMINRETHTNTVQDARVRKTRMLKDQPDEFFHHLDKDITKLKTHAAKEGKKPVLRLNGTSDVAWANHRPAAWGGKNVFEKHRDVQFYDYTKRAGVIRNNKEPNYHVTFSRSESNEPIAKDLLKEGHNVAVVFGGNHLPETHLGHKVVQGDDHDLRFLDPKGNAHTGGHVIGLKAKGDAKADKSGFVVWGHSGEPESKPREAKGPSKYSRVKGVKGGNENGGGSPLAASELARGQSYNDLKRSQPVT